MGTVRSDKRSRFSSIRVLWVMGQTSRAGPVARLMGHALLGLAANIEFWVETDQVHSFSLMFFLFFFYFIAPL